MTTAWYAEQLALLLAVLVTAARSARRPPLRPLAAALAVLAALDVAMLAPLARWAYVAAFAGWYAALGALVAGALVGPWSAATTAATGAWLLAAARLLAPPSGPIPPSEWAALWALSTAVQCGAAVWWGWGAWRGRRRPSEGQAVALVVMGGSVMDGVGPWVAGGAGAAARWEVGRWQSAVTWGAVAGASGWRWARERVAARKKRTLKTL
jgi:hypothetical protein